jgi:hypothetical protein
MSSNNDYVILRTLNTMMVMHNDARCCMNVGFIRLPYIVCIRIANALYINE